MSAGWIIKHFYVIHWALILTAAHNKEEYPSGIQMFNHEVFSTQENPGDLVHEQGHLAEVSDAIYLCFFLFFLP